MASECMSALSIAPLACTQRRDKFSHVRAAACTAVNVVGMDSFARHGIERLCHNPGASRHACLLACTLHRRRHMQASSAAQVYPSSRAWHTCA